MAGKEVRVIHTHIPEISVPEEHTSDVETRVVVLGIETTMGSTAVADVVHVVTGKATVHRHLAGMVADKAITMFDLPKGMPYESAVLIGLLTEGEQLAVDEQVTVVNITHGSQEKALMSDKKAYGILQFAAAGMVRALRRGREIDTAGPSREPYDMDQLPEPIVEEFRVTPRMVAEYKREIKDGTIKRIEEVSHSTPQESKLLKSLREGNAWLRRLFGEYAVNPNDEL